MGRRIDWGLLARAWADEESAAAERRASDPNAVMSGRPPSASDQATASSDGWWERQFFDVTRTVFDLFGLDDAADNLRHFREGGGQPRVFDEEYMKRHHDYGMAMDDNRLRFESSTFTGKSGNGELGKMLAQIPDGGKMRFSDFYDRNIEHPSQLSTFLAQGRTGINSIGDFTVERRGDRYFFDGDVNHRLGSMPINKTTKKAEYHPERFDFNKDNPGHDEAEVLIARKEAANYDMVFNRRQRVNAEVRIEPEDGTRNGSMFPKLTVLKTKWEPFYERPDDILWNDDFNWGP